MGSAALLEFKDITDAELLTLYKVDNNSEALSILLSKYQPLILFRIRHFGFKMEEYEDLMQECMIGLYRAILAYQPSKSSFRAFSQLCIDRMLISIIRSRNSSQKMPVDAIAEYDENVHLIGAENSPEKILEEFDDFENLLQSIEKILSKFEYAVLINSFRGLSYSEIAEKLNTTVKSVDNAIQRVRKKFSKP